jgi:signal transduction histidine kinase
LDFFWWPDAGRFFTFYCVYFYFGVLLTFYLFIKAYLNSYGAEKNRLKYVIAAASFATIGGSLSYPLWYDIPIPPFLNLLMTLYAVIIAYTILRHHLMDITIILRKGLLYSLMAGLLSAFYLSAVFLFGNYLGSRKSAASIVFTIFSIVFFSIIFQPLRDKIQALIDRVFFRLKYDYQKTLRDLSKTARSAEKIDTLLDKLIPSLADTFKLSHACVYIFDKRSARFLPRKTVKLAFDPPPLSNDDEIIRLLIARKEPVFADDVPAAGRTIGAAVFLPILFKDNLVGFLCLGKKLSEEPFSNEDIDLLSTLCNQIGTSIQYAALYEDAMETQKHLYQADKLATVGALAAGLAHEIRNPIAAIKGFTSVIDKAVANNDTEAIKDFRDVVPRQLDRINAIVEKLLTLSKPSQIERKEVDINDLLEDIVKLVNKQTANDRIRIITEGLKASSKITGDPGQLTQAFLNLILNGIQAMPDGGILEIRSSDEDGMVAVEIKDIGIGIPKEKLANIFDPFYTTKDKGTGLGLSVTKKIIEDHRGTIKVESGVGKGTAFIVKLPIS